MQPAELPTYAVIIGAEKTATTMIAAALREHPEAEVPAAEFVGFADPNYDEGTVDELHRQFTRTDVRRRIFKCAAYLGHHEVPERLAADLGDPDLVVIVRNPIKRAVSAWYWYVRLGFLPPIGHEEGIRQLLEGDLDRKIWRRPHAPTGWDMRIIGRENVLEWGLYAHQLEHWLAVAPREKVHVLTDLELAEDATAAIQGLYRSLGLDPAFVPTAHTDRHNSGIYSMRRLRWLRMRLRWTWQQDAQGRWQNARPTRPVPAAANAAFVAVDRYVLARLEPADAPRLTPGLRDALLAYYDDDISKLEQLFRLDLTAWRS